jgi:high-affinity iron transporter
MTFTALRSHLFAIALLLGCAFSSVARAQESAQTVLHLLDYIGVDYAGAVADGKITNADEYAEMREFAAQTKTLLSTLPKKESAPALLAAAEILVKSIADKASPTDIANQSAALRWSIIKTYEVSVTPKQAPDVKVGASLYAAQCVACHGVEGKGDGPASRGLDPAPANFHDTVRMRQRSVYGLYSTITLGVTGTGMASFKQLTEDERWALAFFVGSLSIDEAQRSKGASLWATNKSLNELGRLDTIATLSATEVQTRFGDDGAALFAYLRVAPQVLAVVKQEPLVFATVTMAKSLDAYRNGDRTQATQLAIQAYLEGFELIESSLRSADAELMTRTERAMMDYRGLLQGGAEILVVERQATTVQELLTASRAKLHGVQLSPTTAFVSALVILLREGSEAILVIAAILAFLGRSGRAEARRWVHIGWIAALGLGGVTWIVSNYLVEISGASREITEGVTALVAAGMLLYVGYWLHSKSHSAAWQKFIAAKVSGALSTGTVWTLALISFLAVYREAFETVLFYQALSAQAGPESHSALLGGVLLALLLLVAVAWVILRAAVKLPLGLFFSVSGIVLLILAVVFTGQGIAALQEAGKIGVASVEFISVPMLGIYPTIQTLSAQAIVVVLCVIGFWWVARGSKAHNTAAN